MTETGHIGWCPLAQTGITIARTTAPRTNLKIVLCNVNRMGQYYASIHRSIVDALVVAVSWLGGVRVTRPSAERRVSRGVR